ncbi:hypothetical protein CRI85_02560 [Leuconostoc pseudomesenteroides]|uniref:hypothetical protein n=1 Tax=Leuconostoc pseudomesenteroides TaxID=33968 RepID=UPI001E62DA96|nr:hypothetical protein [Leuconostoc pseudomesenteroides]MCC8439230.1 hypothetical protein [Leuconostoc pseudomesenteroides]
MKIQINQKLVITLVVIFIAVPFIVQLHWRPFYQFAKLLTPGNRGNWLQFWGSYIGVVPSGLIAYFVAKTQIDGQREIDRNKQSVDLYITDLKKLNDLINELRIQSRLTSMLIEKLAKQEIDLRKFFVHYNTMAEEKRLHLKYNEYIENIVETLPNGSAREMHDKVYEFNEILEQIEVNVEAGIIKIDQGLPLDGDEFEKWLISDAKSIDKSFKAAVGSISDEISRYYFI